MPIDIYESTCFEQLWEQFQSTIATPQTTVLATELIVVPSRGWESWFNRRLASEFGCWAQFRFLPLGLWLGESLDRLLGSDLAPLREPDALTWEIAALLPGLCREPEFSAVRGYLAAAGDSDPRQLIDLARCLAGLFDRYLLYRPELIAAWESDRLWPDARTEIPQHADWQRTLWLEIRKRRNYRSVHAMVYDLRKRLDSSVIESGRLPERVSVWLGGDLAPVHLTFLEAIGRHCSIDVYTQTPASEFWGDMRGRRQLLRQLRTQPTSLSEFCREHHLDLLHPLLASNGDLSRQQQMLMVDCDGEPWTFHELDSPFDEEFEAPDTDDSEAQQSPSGEAQPTLLHELQSDIHGACEPQRRELPSDNSVRIHSCHSPLREVEVLRDQLRDALEADPTLKPEDIAVFCPDMTAYAPLIRAVFGVTEPGRPGHIPFHLAGQTLSYARPIPDAFFRLLELLPGRFPASSVLDALNTEPIGAAAGLTSDDVSRLSEWVADAGIRWGIDAAHRSSENLPPSDLNTWQTGFDRLLLGYAMPPGAECLIEDVVTLDRAEGLDSVVLGRLWAFLSRLRNWRERTIEPRPLANWREPLTVFMRQFLDEDADEIGVQRLHGALDSLVLMAEAGGFTDPVPLTVIARELLRQLDAASGSAGVRVGGVTFCGLDDLRSLPYRVIALIGMNDAAFPRTDRPLRFDLMAESPQIGDRTPRGEDRHLFLESLLAARSQLIITFQGQNDRDQKERPASVVVEDLLDVIERSDDSGEDSAGNVRDVVFVRHPLQRFSPRYFDAHDGRLFGFDPDAVAAARQLSDHAAAVPVFATPLQRNDEPVEEIRAYDLLRLIERPWTLFLERLGVFVDGSTAVTTDREPLVLDGLDRWGIGDRWLTGRLSGESPDELSAWLLRSGRLPAGALGRRVLAELHREAETVIRSATEAGIESVDGQLHVDIECAGVRIVGDIAGWSAQTVRRVTFSKIRSTRIPGLWLDTLLATASRKRRCSRSALLVGRRDNGSTVEIEPLAPGIAMENLESLVRWYRIARETPLPLFPESLAVVIDQLRRDPLCLRDPEAEQQVIRRARQAYEGSLQYPGSSQDPTVRSAFAGRYPFDLTCDDVPAIPASGSQNLFAYLAGRIAPRIVDAVGRND